MTGSSRSPQAQSTLYGCISSLMWISAALLLAPVAIEGVIWLVPGPDVLGLELASLILFGIALASTLAILALALWIAPRWGLVISPTLAALVGGLISAALAAVVFPFVAAPLGFSTAMVAVISAAGVIGRYGPRRARRSAHVAFLAAAVLGALVLVWALVLGT
jgi:hypothetical protein